MNEDPRKKMRLPPRYRRPGDDIHTFVIAAGMPPIQNCPSKDILAGDAMHPYDIRLLDADNGILRSVQVRHLSNNAAIRAAYTLAAGRPFEIWQGGRCVYGTDGDRGGRGESGNDIYGTARKMSELYGGQAAATAAERADAALEKNDFRGVERWRLIMAALQNMERRRRGDHGRPRPHPSGNMTGRSSNIEISPPLLPG